jgi:3-hydroxybutyryl-CoA dehydrogenase
MGAGQMGAGIAQVCAATGLEVHLSDAEIQRAEDGKKRIAAILAKQVQKGRLDAAQRDALLARIHPAGPGGGLEGADMAIEAATEDREVKMRIFREADAALPSRAILASNTSSISITRLAAETKRPEQVIGMHFMNPVPVMQLVEVIRGIATSDATYQAVKGLAEQMGKTPVEVNDYPGFIANRILLPMINEAVYCLYEGVASAEAIDTVMKLGMNHPMGPLTLADFIGLDTCLAIMEVLHEGLGDSKYRPCPLLRKMVKAGWLGKKSGRGFFSYA